MTEHKDRHKKILDKYYQRILRFASNGKRLWAILVVAGIVLTMVILLGSMKTSGSSASDSNLNTFLVRLDDLTITVTDSGSIKARTSIDIQSEVEGQATIISLVPEGTYITEEDVKNGKVLVELDGSRLEEEIATREIDFASAEAAFSEATEAYDIQIKQNESDITADELAVKFALLDFQKYLGEEIANKVIEQIERDPNSDIDMVSLLNDPDNLGGAAAQQLDTLKDSILLAKGNLERAIDVNDGTQRLFDANYASELELTGSSLDVERFRIQKKSSEENLKLYRLYDFQKDAETFLSNYYESGRQLERTFAQARARLAQAGAKLKGAKASYELRESRLEKLKQQIDACTIEAPAPGLVVYGSSGDYMRGRTRSIEEGGTVYQRQRIIELPNLAQMIAEINVHESSVDKVRAGQRAKITVDAFPDQTFYGEVLKVAPLPDPQRSFMSPDMKVYETQISIEGFYKFLKPGMSAKVEILVERLEDILIVPVQVVTNRDGKKVCYVVTPQGNKPRVVKTGAFDDMFVQIAEGLEAGEEVLLNPPRATEAGVTDRFSRRQKPGQDEESWGENPSQGTTPPQGIERPQGERQRPQGGGESPQRPQGERQRPQGGGERPQGAKQPQSGQFALTDEMIEQMMGRMVQNNPEKAKEMEQLRKSDPEKFKTELMKNMRERMKQGGSGTRNRQSDTESGQSR